MMKYVESGSGYSHSVGYTYDELNNLTALVETINGTTRTTSYTYDADKRVTSISTNGITESYSYDAYGRITTKVTKNGSTTVLTETYTYKTNSAGQPTSQVATMRSVSGGRDITYSYTYDANGNITSVSDGTNTTSYAYDSANQLIRENNQEVGESWTWTYDAGGNIASRTFYYYSDGDLGGARYAWNYGYNDSDWGELLTDWWGLQSSYDEIGNLVDSGVCTCTWEHGRQLHTMAGWTFFYDANGMRVGRSNGSSTYSYVYNGSQLSRMTVDGLTMDFTYDASGRPVSVTYGNAVYFYVLNLQGDVVAILDSSGNTVVTYAYDAWGYERNRGGSLKDTLGYYNPLRYRGYIYDPEFKLYYLQSRFYDPGLGAFNAPDAFVSTGQGLLGNNMFAYCRNNPVSRIDVTGTFDVKAYETDGDPTSDEGDHRGMRASTGSGTIHTSALSTFKTAIKDAADGLKLAAGQRDMTHFEQHHIVSNKSKVYTPSYKEITDRYNMSLESEHNIVNLPGHRGRHTNRYHDFILFCLKELDAIANGSSDVFYEGFQIIADLFFDFPLLPYAR